MKDSLLTHSELVKKAGDWVSAKFDVTVKEKNSGYEIPDVIGLGYSESIMVECKANRADFHRDKKKRSRIWKDRFDKDLMAGNYRVYCCPKGLLTESELPDGWGLLEVYPSGFVRLKRNIFKGGGYFHELSLRGLRQEKVLLFTAMRDSKFQGEDKIIFNWKF